MSKQGTYKRLRKEFLLANPMCQVHLSGCQLKATDIHHLYSGSNRKSHYLDFGNVKSVCRTCHNTLHNLPVEVLKEMGMRK